jgi:hypothetical protein
MSNDVDVQIVERNALHVSLLSVWWISGAIDLTMRP